MDKPSLRQIAKELDISTAYLSYMVNGKRPWRKDLYQRYMGVVNTFVNSDGPTVNKRRVPIAFQARSMERAKRFELSTSCLGSKHSTTELRPLGGLNCSIATKKVPREISAVE